MTSLQLLSPLPLPSPCLSTATIHLLPSTTSCDQHHIYTHRYQQHQPDLLELGIARLKLFQTITLPAMERQSTRNFLWIIRTDPDLHAILRTQLMHTISESPLASRIVLVADNHNAACMKMAGYLNENMVLLGSWSLLNQYLVAAKQQLRTVLETRLDADDALNRQYLETVQHTAPASLQDPKDWAFWCVHYHYEWHVAPPARMLRRQRNVPLPMVYGHVDGVQASRCITAGLTVGFGVNASRADFPGNMVHTKIEDLIPDCQDERRNKLGLRNNGSTNNGNGGVQQNYNSTVAATPVTTHCLHKNVLSHLPAALRARTTTSTGMSKVSLLNGEPLIKEGPLPPNHPISLQWDTIEQDFGVQRDTVRDARSYLLDHTQAIAADNLKGQCTEGHTCKPETQALLRSLANGTGGKDEAAATKDSQSQQPQTVNQAVTTAQ